MTMVKIDTYMGELEIESIYEDSFGYHAVTGEGLTRRTWYLTKARYEKLRQEVNSK